MNGGTEMKEVNLESWEEFEQTLQGLEIETGPEAEFLYRGQENCCWGLQTTLERNGREIMSLKDYHELCSVVKPQVESFAGMNWDILVYPEGIEEWLRENDSFMPQAFGRPAFQATYSYMLYLRHHGFPSPFIDWTGSPYIAAFFAFRRQSTARVSIYAYLKRRTPVVTRIGSPDYPYIHILGPYVRTHRRHFLQQGRYTICVVRDSEGEGIWRYASHQDAYHRGDGEDMLWKFNIPCSERRRVLAMLDNHNISALSLFESEDALMETMAIREIDLRERR